MTAYRPNLPAARVHSNLKRSLSELRQAEQNTVLWFSEVMTRKLYRGARCSSMQQYAIVRLGFSKSKTSQFIRLCQALNTLPKLKQSVSSGTVSWTKAREVAKVATPRTEAAWVAEAKQSSNRELEKKVCRVQGQARIQRGQNKNQVLLGEGDSPSRMMAPEGSWRTRRVCANGNGVQRLGVIPRPGSEAINEVPVNLQVRLNPEEYARCEALMEKLRKQGQKGSRAELLLAGLEALVLANADGGAGGEAEGGPGAEAEGIPGAETRGASCGDLSEAEDRRAASPKKFTRVNFWSPYQVVIQLCEDCGTGRVTTSQGLKPLDTSNLKAILCDSRVLKNGKRNRATIRQTVRRHVLSRDRYRCCAPGCERTSFLNVHHIVPREVGGSNKPENLVTLCSGCHRALHELADRDGSGEFRFPWRSHGSRRRRPDRARPPAG